MTIRFDIDQEDVAIVLKPDGHIDVYCPEMDDNALANNVRLLRILLVSLVREASETKDVNTLLEQIDKHIAPEPTNRTLH